MSMDKDKSVLVEKQGAVLIVTLNRPERKNALHPPASRELAAVFREFESDTSLRVAIVTGAGQEAFCAGNDVRFAANASREEQRLSEEGFGGLTHYFQRTKPVIAAVNGLAMGGGFEMVLAADLVVASTRARFSLPEARIGVAALGGGIHRLVRQIPYKKATEMLITGDDISAAEASQLGVVNHLVESGGELEKSLSIAEKITACAPISVEISLSGARKLFSDLTLEQSMAEDLQALKRLAKSRDAYEGMKAFAEKRKPEWTGQ